MNLTAVAIAVVGALGAALAAIEVGRSLPDDVAGRSIEREGTAWGSEVYREGKNMRDHRNV